MNRLNSIMATGAFLLTSFTGSNRDGGPFTLKDAFAGTCYIGTALNTGHITGKDTASVRVITENFSAIVAENCMKSGPLQPREGEFNFDLADKFVEFGERTTCS